ncbi:hypothetical protein HMPREF9431_01489 [Segatella oulorum F0390]|uniref:Uncharacterized protein n=1 Tax=Segatella oulorum F0390 TaxID=702438 RepID=G1WCD8_9BACT|nr:hypothetical protein HMPREF9431_01489 [Segatella oulorum F0390]
MLIAVQAVHHRQTFQAIQTAQDRALPVPFACPLCCMVCLFFICAMETIELSQHIIKGFHTH